MKKFRNGATLLITTIALSIAAVTSAVFTSVFVTYGRMGSIYLQSDREKIKLRNEMNSAYEYFLKDNDVEINGVSKSLRSGWLLGDDSLTIGSNLEVPILNFLASFTLIDIEEHIFNLSIDGEFYTINSEIKEIESNQYALDFLNFDRRES